MNLNIFLEDGLCHFGFLSPVCCRICAVLKHFDDVLRCPNMAIQEADDSEMEDNEDSLTESARSDVSFAGRPKGIRIREKRDVKWLGEPIKVDSRRKFFR